MFTLHQLEEKLNKPLKGMASQLLMAPKHRLAEMEDAKNKIKLDSGERKGVMQGHGSTGRIE